MAPQRATLCFVVMALLTPSLAAKPYLPADPAEVIEVLPAMAGVDAGDLRRLQAASLRQPDNRDIAVRLAQSYLRLGRAEGDPRYGGRAEAALRPWWNLPDPPPDVLLLRATILQSRHKFAAALADLDRLLAVQSDDLQAWMVRATILQVQGRFPEAVQSCGHLARRVTLLVTVLCARTVTALTGDATDSYDTIAAAQRAAGDTVEPDISLWAWTTRAEIAWRLGDVQRAEAGFRQALSVGMRDVYLLGAYADFLLDAERFQDVIALLAQETQPDPLLLRLAIAERRLDDQSADTHIEELRRRFSANRERGDAIHQREEARFELAFGDPERALKLAQQNWTVQREPWDVRLLLEAARAAGNPGAAEPAVRWIEQWRQEDVRSRLLAAQVSRPTKP